MSAFINLDLIKNPLNWAIIFMMLFIVGIASDIILTRLK